MSASPPASTETTIVHEIAITVGCDYAAVVKRLAEAVVTMAPGTKLVLRYERLVRLHEPLSTAANRLSASAPPTPRSSKPERTESKPPKAKPVPKPAKAAQPARTPIRVVPAIEMPKREPPIADRPPVDYEPTFTRTPLRERLKERRAAEAAT